MKNLLCIDEETLDKIIKKYRDDLVSITQPVNRKNPKHVDIGAAQTIIQELEDLKSKMKSCEAVWDGGFESGEGRSSASAMYKDFITNTSFEDL